MEKLTVRELHSAFGNRVFVILPSEMVEENLFVVRDVAVSTALHIVNTQTPHALYTFYTRIRGDVREILSPRELCRTCTGCSLEAFHGLSQQVPAISHDTPCHLSGSPKHWLSSIG